ncbi:MAG: transcription termination/antitermination protein NusA, partial [Candidatus Moranbacteria bacterium]|nr:transcription termination/antitermination protein NusA [Candidatus Moranbacteria bacterium]
FELEVPEIFSGTVEIKAVAREAGARTKIAVASNEEGVDPIGSCVGQKGTRVQAVIDELGGEKIDIIEWNEDLEKFIAASLSPAKVLAVTLDDDKKEATVKVPEDQLSLAIGKRGQNVRLAAKLTGWRIDMIGEMLKGADATQTSADNKSQTNAEIEKPKNEETEQLSNSAKPDVASGNRAGKETKKQKNKETKEQKDGENKESEKE